MNDILTDELCVEVVYREIKKNMIDDPVLREAESSAQTRVLQMVKESLEVRGVDIRSEQGKAYVSYILRELGCGGDYKYEVPSHNRRITDNFKVESAYSLFTTTILHSIFRKNRKASDVPVSS